MVSRHGCYSICLAVWTETYTFRVCQVFVFICVRCRTSTQYVSIFCPSIYQRGLSRMTIFPLFFSRFCFRNWAGAAQGHHPTLGLDWGDGDYEPAPGPLSKPLQLVSFRVFTTLTTFHLENYLLSSPSAWTMQASARGLPHPPPRL